MNDRPIDDSESIDDWRSLPVADLIEIGDLDALTSRVDSLVFDEAWSEIVDVRDRCRAALKRGKQLWPAAAYAEYRLALDAPSSFAAAVLESEAQRFTLGPFAEVIASTHTFEALKPYLHISPATAALAHECVMHGESLSGDAFAKELPDVFGLPLELASWEPDYETAIYHQDRAEFPSPMSPALSTGGDAVSTEAGRVIADRPTTDALLDLTVGWTRSSTGRSQAVAVEGSAQDAIGALGVRRAHIVRLDPSDAIHWMVWAGASGGAHGRRRGMSAGRQTMWWAVLHLTGLLDDDPYSPQPETEEIGVAISELRWWWWDDGSPATGWNLRLAIEDPEESLAWAISASDVAITESPTP